MFFRLAATMPSRWRARILLRSFSAIAPNTSMRIAFTISSTHACFGGGMGKGEVCGACTGALMVLGMKYGQFDLSDNESRAKSGSMAVKFFDEFEKRKGSYVCRNILGCDLRTEEGSNYARSNGLFRTLCPEMVRTAAEILTEMLRGDE